MSNQRAVYAVKVFVHKQTFSDESSHVCVKSYSMNWGSLSLSLLRCVCISTTNSTEGIV